MNTGYRLADIFLRAVAKHLKLSLVRPQDGSIRGHNMKPDRGIVEKVLKISEGGFVRKGSRRLGHGAAG